MTTHTPGPWRAKLYKEWTLDNCANWMIENEQGFHIADTFNSEDDANLIAAAPRLRAALEQITRCAKMKGPVGTTAYIISDDRMTEAFAALAESEGR